WPQLDAFEHLFEGQILLAQSDIHFIEQHQLEPGIRQITASDFPARLRHRPVAYPVLSFPGEPPAARVEHQLLAPRLEGALLGWLPGALDELHDRNTKPMPETSQHHAQRGGCFALAGAGMNNDQTLLTHGLRHPAVLDRLAAFHPLPVCRLFRGIAHVGLPRAATHLTSRSASSLVLYIENPTRTSEPPGTFRTSTGRDA